MYYSTNFKYKPTQLSNLVSNLVKDVLDYSTPSLPPWVNGNVMKIDIPGVENMTKEEAEAWIIRNNLLNSEARKLISERWEQMGFTKGLDVVPQITSNAVKEYVDEQGDIIGSMPEVDVSVPAVAKPKREGRRFKVGEHYTLYPFKNKKLKREYVVKKTIYSIEDYEVRILIMKQVKGDYHTKYTLNRKDCLMFHLKYEEGLEVYSMDLDWKLLNKKEKKKL